MSFLRFALSFQSRKEIPLGDLLELFYGDWGTKFYKEGTLIFVFGRSLSMDGVKGILYRKSRLLLFG
ncbi:hypothetical protein N7516_004739 [Penicillium verrucosum]|uniref:uncharacterized protein n=1 Tax=Penicillium verrucosum TaxID=60171 RepID=UPI002545001D|nr:uncharacterized protein N7516_004739 [Penicillium verrucosum]KAJ5944571.1 hypothetical protein N7516_004739 [Penicillium verrucosum]